MTVRDWFRAGRWVDVVLVLMILGSIALAFDAIQDPFW